jgi:restriction endonuclease S subunit
MHIFKAKTILHKCVVNYVFDYCPMKIRNKFLCFRLQYERKQEIIKFFSQGFPNKLSQQ